MPFAPINGQQLCAYRDRRFGLCKMKTNGCAILAIYNALGLLGRPMPIEEILGHFSRWYRPHIFGITPRRIRNFFKKNHIDFSSDLQNGDIAVATYWNRCLWKKIPNPFGGAHTVCIRFDGDFCVYNRFSNRDRVYRYASLAQLLEGRRLMGLIVLKSQTMR